MASNFHNQQAPIYDIDITNAEIDIISFLLHGHHQYENNEYWLKIKEKLFISPVAKKIFQVLEKLNIEGKIQVNLATVSNELRQLCANQDSLLNSCFAFLQQTSPDFNYYEIGEQINILKISNQKQEITKLFQQVQTTPLTISNSANYFSKWKIAFDGILEDQLVIKHYDGQELVQQYWFLVEQAQDHRQYGNQFLKTGYSMLDYKIKGLIGSQLVILAARPGLGKTTFAINLLCNNLAEIIQQPETSFQHNKKAIGFFSLEMNKESILEKIVAVDTRLEIKTVKRLLEGKTISGDEQQYIKISLDKICKTNLLFCERSDITIDQIVSMIRVWKKNYDLKLIIIDYLQLINVEGSLNNSNVPQYQRIAKISRTLKTLANDLGICVFALAQLNRRPEERRGDYREPMISDLRESGSIEQDADIVLLLYQDKNNLETNSEDRSFTNDSTIFLKIGKNRHGEIGTIEFQFEHAIGQFIQTKQF